MRPAATEEQKQAIAADYAAGMHVEDICKKYRVKPWNVYDWMQKAGVRREGKVKQHRRIIRRASWFLPVESRRYIVKCWDCGYSVQEIARILHVNEGTVQLWLRRFEEEGEEGLQTRVWRRPERAPHETPAEVKAAIRELAAAEPGMSLEELRERASVLRYPDGRRRMNMKTVRKILRG